jgi:peptidylprolyl isomerase
VLAAVGIAAVIVGILLLTRGGSDKKENVAADETPTTELGPTTTAMASAKGKPCVKLADPLPPGAPAVPVKEGPPPPQLIKEDLKAGTGPEVKSGDTVTANYIGVACSTGKIFDSTYTTGTPQPATFPLAQVIPGWQQGLPGMKVGGQRLLGIPSEMAYKQLGSAPHIAPDEALWFVVEITATKASQ